MLKRCQVLLRDWQVEYLKKEVDKQKESFSEILRRYINRGILGEHKRSVLGCDYDRLEFEARKEIDNG